MEKYYTYVLESEKTKRLYIGQTNNVFDRLQRHNRGENQSTKHGVPWKLLIYKEFISRSEAVQLEMKLKKWKSPRKVLLWVESQKM